MSPSIGWSRWVSFLACFTLILIHTQPLSYSSKSGGQLVAAHPRSRTGTRHHLNGTPAWRRRLDESDTASRGRFHNRPPLSSHTRNRAGAVALPIRPSIFTRPSGRDSAPYFTALVHNSLIASDMDTASAEGMPTFGTSMVVKGSTALCDRTHCRGLRPKSRNWRSPAAFKIGPLTTSFTARTRATGVARLAHCAGVRTLTSLTEGDVSCP